MPYFWNNRVGEWNQSKDVFQMSEAFTGPCVEI